MASQSPVGFIPNPPVAITNQNKLNYCEHVAEDPSYLFTQNLQSKNCFK
jgi:hypothetical protein